MRERLVLGTLTLAALLAVGSCKDDVGLTSVPIEVEIFTAALSGANEVPARTTTATGTATLSAVGGVLLYRIDVTGITNVFGSHIHGPAPAGQNTGIILNFCGTGAPAPACVSGTGVLASGVATPVPAVPFDSLLVLLRNGQAYVNVHTNDGNATPNEGPGDFPGGEIRGQVAPQ